MRILPEDSKLSGVSQDYTQLTISARYLCALPEVRPQDAEYFICTLGSTRDPEMIIVEHASLVAEHKCD